MKFRILILLIIISYNINAQVYLRPNNSYGTVGNRWKADSVQHIPRINDTLSHTTDTSSQIRVVNGKLMYRATYWKEVAGGTNYWTSSATNKINNTNSSGVGIGISNPQAKLDVTDTLGGVLLPRLTTTQKNNIGSPSKGMLLYDSTLKKYQYYNGTAWKDMGGGVLPAGHLGWVQINKGDSTFYADTAIYVDTTNKKLVLKNDASIHNLIVGKGSGNQFGNSVLGEYALVSNTTGSGNTAIGYESLNQNTAGYDNVAIGVSAMGSNLSGVQNTAIGNQSLSGNLGNNNTAIGYNAIALNTSGNSNTALGSNVLGQATGINYNIGIGLSAMEFSSGDNNIVVGRNTMKNSNGNDNLVIGNFSLQDNAGNYNTTIGNEAGFSTIGNKNVFLGYRAGYNDTGSNHLYIANDSNNTLIFGNFSNHRVGINTTSPSYTLDVTGKVQVTDTLFAKAFVKQGGTSSQILRPDGGILTAGTNITIAGGTISASGGGAGTVTNIATGYGLIGGPIITTGTLILDSATLSNYYLRRKDSSVNGGYYPYATNPKGYLTNSIFSSNNTWSGTQTFSNDIGGTKWTIYNSNGRFVFDNNAISSNGSGQITASADAIINSLTIGKGTGNKTTNTALGVSALSAVTTGTNNTAVGYHALQSSQDGIYNTAIGTSAMTALTTGSENVAIGADALLNTTSGSSNEAIGRRAMFNAINASSNVSIGEYSLFSNIDGNGNVAIGTNALYTSQHPNNNIAIGESSLYTNDGGTNLAIGHSSLTNNTTGTGNTVIGDFVMGSNVTGDNNTALGLNAGFSALGSGNVFLGYQAGYNETGSNKLYIANSNTATPLIYGDFSTGQIGLGTNSPTARLHVTDNQPTAIFETTDGDNPIAKFNVKAGSGNSKFALLEFNGTDAGGLNSLPIYLGASADYGVFFMKGGMAVEPGYGLPVGANDPIFIAINNVQAKGFDENTVDFVVKAGGSVAKVADMVQLVNRIGNPISVFNKDSWLGLLNTNPSYPLDISGEARIRDRLNITTGSNKSLNTGTFTAGTVTISNTSVTASSKIFIQYTNCTNCGTAYIGTITAGTSFVVNSSNGADASNFNYWIIN